MSSTSTSTTEQDYPHTPPEAHERAHPSDWTYIQVGLVLALITAAEVSTYFIDFGDAAVPLLLVMMVIKFAMVAAWFMHLRFDSRLFRRLFVAGLITAIAVYLAALTMFHYWD